MLKILFNLLCVELLIKILYKGELEEYKHIPATENAEVV